MTEKGATDRFSVSDATPADAAAVAALLAELAAGEGAVSDVDEAAVRRFMDAPDNGLLVARVSDDVVGVLTYALFPSFFRAARWAQIGHLVVREDRRRLGVATSLLTTACGRFAQDGVREVLVSALVGNEAALELYRRAGFVERTIGLERVFGGE